MANNGLSGVLGRPLGSKASSGSSLGMFYRATPGAVIFAKTGTASASINAGTIIDVGGRPLTFNSAAPITMPTLASGTDYAIWLRSSGALVASANFATAPDDGLWRRIGGFHYSPGGNATAQSGGNTTPQINEFSFYDLKFKPNCPDPRGMTLVAGVFWSDIYLCGVDHTVNGTSKFNVTQADGASPPKIPLAFGGNGTTTYANGNWWNFAEVLRAYGKRLPTYSEFAALAYGTTEASSVGTDQVSTVLNAIYTSKWGVIQASGVLWTWGDEFGGGAAAASYTANTQGRGSTYQMENAVIFGGSWGEGANAGSRASLWDRSPSLSSNLVGARGVADHLSLE